jgi:hypothetical protein
MPFIFIQLSDLHGSTQEDVRAWLAAVSPNEDGNSRRAPRSRRPWTTGGNERKPRRNIPEKFFSCFFQEVEFLFD